MHILYKNDFHDLGYDNFQMSDKMTNHSALIWRHLGLYPLRYTVISVAF